MATKSQRLGEAIENLQAGALRAMRQNDEAAARELLQVCFCQLRISWPAQCNRSASSHCCFFWSVCDLHQHLVTFAAGKDTCVSSLAEVQGQGSGELYSCREAEQANRYSATSFTVPCCGVFKQLLQSLSRLWQTVSLILRSCLSSISSPLVVLSAGAKQTELIAVLHQSGNLHRISQKPFSVDPAGAVSMDGDDLPSAGRRIAHTNAASALATICKLKVAVYAAGNVLQLCMMQAECRCLNGVSRSSSSALQSW